MSKNTATTSKKNPIPDFRKVATEGQPRLSLTAPLSPQYEEVVARFEIALRDRGKAELSIRTYLSSVTRFLAFLQHSMGLDVPLDTVTKEHAREWLRALRDAGLQPVTIRGRAQAAQQLFKLAIEDGEATTNPFAGLPLPTVVMPEPTILSDEEVQGMVDACRRVRVGFLWDKRDAAVIMLLYDCGLRASELLAIREEDIDWKAGTLFIHGKGRRNRIVGVGATAMRALNRYAQARKRYESERRHWQRQPEGSAIWVSRRGGQLTPSGLKTLLHRRAEEAGITKRIYPHSFRHSSATKLAEDMPESELRAHFGWSPNSTMVYRYTRTSLAQRAVTRHRRVAPGDKIRL